MTTRLDLSNFLQELASGSPTPGGGSTAALAGALGAALAAMVAQLTTGRKRYADVDDQMQDVAARADQLRARLTTLVIADAAAYDQVSAAYRLPRQTDEQKRARQQAIQQALKGACQTPLATMDACQETLRLLVQVVEAGNRNAITDAQVGVLLADAGRRGAILNVRINLRDIADRSFVDNCETAIEQAQAEADDLLRRIAQAVEERTR